MQIRVCVTLHFSGSLETLEVITAVPPPCIYLSVGLQCLGLYVGKSPLGIFNFGRFSPSDKDADLVLFRASQLLHCQAKQESLVMVAHVNHTVTKTGRLL